MAPETIAMCAGGASVLPFVKRDDAALQQQVQGQVGNEHRRDKMNERRVLNQIKRVKLFSVLRMYPKTNIRKIVLICVERIFPAFVPHHRPLLTKRITCSASAAAGWSRGANSETHVLQLVRLYRRFCDGGRQM